jgi:hypothetical protein
MSYVYIKSKGHELYTVGFYRPDGTWEPESDWVRSEYAAKRVRYLNGAAIESQRHLQDCIGRSGPYMNEID